jgi:fructose-specific phosphotransferase system IIA component
VKIQDLLQKNCILIDLKGNDKSEILTQMATYMASLFDLEESENIVRRIVERESEMSTGIGFGIAIPHARLSGIDRPYMIAGRSVQGIPFEAIDEQLVHLIFMMVSPTNTTTEHTQILSSLSRIMSYEEMRNCLFAADTPEKFLDAIINGENKYVD